MIKPNQKFAEWLLIVSLLVVIISIILFLKSQSNLELSKPIDTDKFNHFGAFIAGTAGILISFAGTILIYVSLSHQRKDIQQNRLALGLQIKELRNQKIELELTREVFKQQSLTAEMQRFETTFFNLLNLVNLKKEEITFDKTVHFGKAQPIRTTKSGTEAMQVYLDRAINSYHRGIEKRENSEKVLYKLYEMQTSLEKHLFPKTNSFFETLVILLELLQSKDPQIVNLYSNIIKSQLSHLETVILAHHCLVDNRKSLLVKYGLFDHLVSENFVEEYFFIHLSSKKAS